MSFKSLNKNSMFGFGEDEEKVEEMPEGEDMPAEMPEDDVVPEEGEEDALAM